jgi:hypothetical protein
MTAHAKNAPARCGKHPDRLYDCTENDSEKTDDPTTVREAQVRHHRWYIDQKSKFYNPYLIQVTDIDDQDMWFMFLNSMTGDPLFKGRVHKIAYRDIRYAWAERPSTAHKVKQNDQKNCGLLFISDDYMMDPNSLPGGKQDRDEITNTGGGDGKWPFSAGQDAQSRVEQLRRSISGHSESLRRDLEEILRLLDIGGLAWPA